MRGNYKVKIKKKENREIEFDAYKRKQEKLKKRNPTLTRKHWFKEKKV